MFAISPTDALASSLHGEVFALVAAAFLHLCRLTVFPPSLPTLCTDHLNSVRFLQNPPTPSPSHPPSSPPALPLYLWLNNVLSRSPNPPQILYTLAHTSATSIPALTNDFVDDLTTYHCPPSPLLPALPLPTFFMPDFVLHAPSLGYIDASSIPATIRNLNASSLLSDPLSRPNLTLFRSLYDTHPPPLHPYTRASSAFSATVQLYARSAQLDTAWTRRSRFRDVSPHSHFGCFALESAHHVFIQCPQFSSLRDDALATLGRDTSALLHSTADIPSSFADAILSIPHTLFTDNGSVWPQYHSHYCLGPVPTVPYIVAPPWCNSVSSLAQCRLRSRIATLWHTTSIHLAARIWGKYKRAFNSSTRREPPHLTLPPHLSHLLSS